MIRTILIDDEVHCLETLSILLKDYCPEVEIVNRCKSAKDAIDLIEKEKPDVVFLDIEMPGMTGFEMLEKISPIDFSVVFTTSYDQYAIKAIRFSAFDYLLKPVDPKELIAAIHRIKSQKQLPSSEQYQMLFNHVNNKEAAFRKMAIPTADGFELIAADNIVRCEADNNYTHLYLKNKTKVTASKTLKEIEEQLSSFSFFVRVHNSHFVNMNEAVRYVRGDGGYLVMSDGASVNVSRSRKEALMKWF